MTTEEKYAAVRRLLRDCPDILTPIKAAKWLHCSKNDVYANINNSSLPAYLYRSSYLIAKSDLIDYIVAHTDDPPKKNIHKRRRDDE